MAKKNLKNFKAPFYTPKPKQQLFHESGANECFFGGSKSPGKSKAIVEDATIYALQFPGSDPHLFRESYDILADTLIKEFKESIPKELYTFNEQRHEARLVNGSVLKFRFLENVDDAKRYDGRSIPYVGVDELTKHDEETIQILLSCNRSAKGWPVMFRATGNPGGKGHGWVKDRYVEPTDKGKHTYIDEITGNLIQFIPATVYDGILVERDPGYVKRMENLPEIKRKALLYGDWDVFEGQYYSNFGPRLEEKPFHIPPHLLDDGFGTSNAYGSMDYGWGLDGVSSFSYWYKDPYGVCHKLFNWWRKGMSVAEQADDLYDYIKSFPFTSSIMPSVVFCDSNMFSKPNLEKEGEKAPIDFFRERFGGKTLWVPANKNRIHGAVLLHAAFEPDPLTKEVMFRYWPEYNKTFEDCIKKMIHDPDRPGDALKHKKDDWYDDCRYGWVGLKSQMNVSTPQPQVRTSPPRENINAIVARKAERNEIGVTGI